MLDFVVPIMTGRTSLAFCACNLSPDVSKMRNLVMGFGRGKAKKTSAAKARQLDMLERMREYCEVEGVCRR